jgi:hypothetical protein
MRILTQNNPNSDLVPDEADGMVDEEDIPSLDIGLRELQMICGFWETK